MERVEELTETIRQLRSGLAPPHSGRFWFAGFSKTEAAMLDRLADGTIHGHDELRRLIGIVNRRDGSSSLDSLTMAVFWLRKKLRRMAAADEMRVATIDTHHGRGFSMSPASIGAIEALAV
jgi:DNA-binding winged helix-turn-helix (wHTH) protein